MLTSLYRDAPYEASEGSYKIWTFARRFSVNFRLQWNLHIADIFGTNFDVRCRELSAVSRCHPLFYCILGRKYLSVFRRCSLCRGVR